MGFAAEKRGFGWYRTNTEAPAFAAVTVTSLTPSDVLKFLDDVRSYFGDRDVSIDLTEENHSLALAGALRSAGYSNEVESVYLAHVGELPTVVCEEAEVAPASDLREFCRVKLMAFDGTEDEPTPERLGTELAIREAEATGEGRFRAALVGDETAAICGFYEGQDYGIFILGTRVPFRRRGIASLVLRAVLEEARDTQASSVIIWCDAGGAPEALYRKLGFTDQFHRRWRFTRPAS